MDFIYIATRPMHFEGAHKLFSAMAPRATDSDPAVEGLRYFHFRYLWERKLYGELSIDQIEFLKKAKERYRDPRIESLYQPFNSGQIPADVVIEQFRKFAPRREVSFRTELVDGQAALFEANLPSRKSRKTETRVKSVGESTFRTGFRAAFGAETQKAEEN